MQVVVNDILVTYSDVGKGDTLICLHGWMHDHNTFKELTDILSKTYRIISLDLPNFGASQSSESVVSVDDYANFVKLFIAKLNLNNYVLLGHSMGCQISLYGVGTGILQPEKLVMIAPAGVRSGKKIMKSSLKIASILLRKIVPKKYKKIAYRAIGSDYKPDMSSNLKLVINNTLNTDITAQASAIKVPTIFIAGEKDKSTPLWMVQKLHKIVVSSRLEVAEGEQHWLHQNSPDLVAGYIKDFLDEK